MANKQKKLNVAVVGYSGLVGQKLLEIIKEPKYTPIFKNAKFYLFDRDNPIKTKSCGKLDKHYDLAFFVASAAIAKKYAKLFTDTGCIVIDNSSHFRMCEIVPLVVAGVNCDNHLLNSNNNKGIIIANPNCSTIIATSALKPLADALSLKRVIYNTYQSVSGAGLSGLADLELTASGNPPKFFAKPIHNNIIPHIDDITPSGYTKEEYKLIFETRKILYLPTLPITATAVRVPIQNCHSISLNLEFEKDLPACHKKTLTLVTEILSTAHNIKITQPYPTVLDAHNNDYIHIGRIRKDNSVKSGLNLWLVSDNLRIGAATNALDIAKKLI
ncbi:MAG: aspartate-semialdehyde dehydrogenase [Firmicutes bacterium]|nr:aspartate-semialdehyde dehydrogenase [Bacillota bacterium]